MHRRIRLQVASLRFLSFLLEHLGLVQRLVEKVEHRNQDRPRDHRRQLEELVQVDAVVVGAALGQGQVRQDQVQAELEEQEQGLG